MLAFARVTPATFLSALCSKDSLSEFGVTSIVHKLLFSPQTGLCFTQFPHCLANEMPKQPGHASRVL